jgi:hypothetical protein
MAQSVGDNLWTAPSNRIPNNKRLKPNVEILYVTFARDLHWLRYSLESIRKYASGFSGVKIVVPTWDVDKFLQFERYSTPDCPVLVKNFLEYPGKGFVHHLAMKCYADVFCPEADFILHMDPDCLFKEKVAPDDYFVDGKPVLVIEPYDVLRTIHPARYNWKRVTEEALKLDCTHETMCRHPAVHDRATYREMRAYIERVHQTPFLDFVLKQKNSYPQGFGEFNTLGAFAMQSAIPYYLIDRSDQGDKYDPPSKVWQGWSYQGVSKNMDTINRILCSS